MKKTLQVNGAWKQAGVVILISKKDKLENYSEETKKGQFILIKGTIYQEEVTIMNIYAPNIGSSNFLK
jgi:hypothetical protein